LRSTAFFWEMSGSGFIHGNGAVEVADVDQSRSEVDLGLDHVGAQFESFAVVADGVG